MRHGRSTHWHPFPHKQLPNHPVKRLRVGAEIFEVKHGFGIRHVDPVFPFVESGIQSCVGAKVGESRVGADSSSGKNDKFRGLCPDVLGESFQCRCLEYRAAARLWRKRGNHRPGDRGNRGKPRHERTRNRAMNGEHGFRTSRSTARSQRRFRTGGSQRNVDGCHLGRRRGDWAVRIHRVPDRVDGHSVRGVPGFVFVGRRRAVGVFRAVEDFDLLRDDA